MCFFYDIIEVAKKGAFFMKKVFRVLCISLCMTLIFTSGSALAKGERIVIPDYKCIINNTDVHYKNSEYPLISYKDITYFPMTWDYCRALNLTSSWTGSELYIAFKPSGGELPIYNTVINSKYNTAVIPLYPIYINGKQIDNSKEEYPLLNFRGVTYFPMTWHYATEEFNWTVSWADRTFTLDSSYTIFNSISKTFPIDEKTAFLSRHISEQVEIEPNVFTVVDSEKHYKFDYETENLTETTPEEMGIDDIHSFYEKHHQGNLEFTLENKDGKIFIDGIELKEITYLLENDAPDASVSCTATELGGVKTYNITVYTDYKIPAPYTPKVSYNFVRIGDEFVFIDSDASISKAVMLSDGCVYVNTHNSLNYKGYVRRAANLYKIDKDKTVTKINSLHPDYNSMKIVGTANDRVYLLCEWGENDNPVLYGSYEVSASNDGYFTLDKNGNFTRISNYIHSYQHGDYDFVSPSGKLFIITPVKREIERIY